MAVFDLDYDSQSVYVVLTINSHERRYRSQVPYLAS